MGTFANSSIYLNTHSLMRQAAIFYQRRDLFMTADTFAILCTIAPFAILLIGVTHPGLQKKHLRKKFTITSKQFCKIKAQKAS